MTAKRVELWISAASVAVTVTLAVWGFSTGIRVDIAVLQTRVSDLDDTGRETRNEVRELRQRFDARRVAKPDAQAQRLTSDAWRLPFSLDPGPSTIDPPPP